MQEEACANVPTVNNCQDGYCGTISRILFLKLARTF